MINITRARIALPCCLLLLLSACAQRPWNVLLVTFDTTRADFIGCYGKESARTPTLDRLAAEGFLFEHAYTSNPVTQPSHSTILTGVYPMVHGVRDNGLFQLPEERETLAEILGARGYATGAAVGGFPLTKEFGTAQGFDFYDDDLKATRQDMRGQPARARFQTWYDERPAGHVNDAIRPWLREQGEAPFFVWLHYWDPHEPHIAPAPYGQLFAHDPYQGEIAYADETLGALLRELDAMGELERTLVVMTSDHGEGRMEHNEMTHAFLAYDPTLHVPLIMRPPGAGGGRRVAERVGTVDIVPTILDLLGFEIPEALQGRSLVPLMRGEERARERRAYYSESLSPRFSHGFGELRALYWGPWKYIHGPRPELFNLEQDPGELDDLAAERPEERQRLKTALEQFLNDHASADAADAAYEASEETKRRLAALGYLSTGGDDSQAVSEVLSTDGVAPQDRVGDFNLQQRLRSQLNGGRYRAAKRTALQLLEDAPDHDYYRGALIAAHLGLGEIAEAAQLVEETETVSPANLGSFLQVARALFDDGDQERGLRMTRRLIAVEETANRQLFLSRMLAEAGETAAAQAATARAFELEPEHREARLAMIRQWVEQGEAERAEDELKSLLAAHPIDTEALVAYARLLRESGRHDQALVRIERVLRLAPYYCQAHLEHLELLIEAERAAEAAEAHATLRERCPQNQDMLERAAALMEDKE